MKQLFITIFIFTQANFLFAQPPYENSGQLEGVMNLRESAQANIDRQFADLDLFMSIASVYLDELPAWKKFIGKEAKLSSYCIDGDCENGYGKKILEKNGITSVYIGNFFNGQQNDLGALYLVDGDRLILSNYCKWVLNSPRKGIHNKFDIKVNRNGKLGIKHNGVFIGSLDDFVKSRGTNGTLYIGAQNSSYDNRLRGLEEFIYKQVGFFSKETFEHGDIFTYGTISGSYGEKNKKGFQTYIDYYPNGNKRTLRTKRSFEKDIQKTTSAFGVEFSYQTQTQLVEIEDGPFEEYFSNGKQFYRANKVDNLLNGPIEIFDEQGDLKVKGEIVKSSHDKRKITYTLTFVGTFDYRGKEYSGEILFQNLSRGWRGYSMIYRIEKKSKILIKAVNESTGSRLKEKLQGSGLKKLQFGEVSSIFKVFFQSEL